MDFQRIDWLIGYTLVVFRYFVVLTGVNFYILWLLSLELSFSSLREIKKRKVLFATYKYKWWRYTLRKVKSSVPNIVCQESISYSPRTFSSFTQVIFIYLVLHRKPGLCLNYVFLAKGEEPRQKTSQLRRVFYKELIEIGSSVSWYCTYTFTRLQGDDLMVRCVLQQVVQGLKHYLCLTVLWYRSPF